MNSTKIGVLILVSILALGAMSVGYALWNESLLISGTVDTSLVDAEWGIHACYDNEPPDKNVSWVEATISNDGNALFVRIINAYPCITYNVDFDIHCIGSMPIRLGPFDVDYGSLPLDSTIIITDLDYLSGGPQLEFGDQALGTLSVHLDNSAVQSSIYVFSISIYAFQYDQYGPPVNNPPDIPSYPTPLDNADFEDVYDIFLNCTVSDPNGDLLNVSFYWGNGTLIALNYLVPSNSLASIFLPNYINPDWLSHNTTNEWYVVVDDGEYYTQGPLWDFKTCIAWDLNIDRVIDSIDISIMTSHYGEPVIPAGSEPWDVNNDGIADSIDMSIIISHYGESY